LKLSDESGLLMQLLPDENWLVTSFFGVSNFKEVTIRDFAGLKILEPFYIEGTP